jgi:hypothetical protein
MYKNFIKVSITEILVKYLMLFMTTGNHEYS